MFRPTSPAEPFVHPLGEVAPASAGAAVRIGGDVVVFEQHEVQAGQAPAAADALGVARLTGSPRLVVSHVAGIDGEPNAGFDFDGERVTWLEATLRGTRIRVATIETLLVSPLRSARRRCPLQLDRRPRLS